MKLYRLKKSALPSDSKGAEDPKEYRLIRCDEPAPEPAAGEVRIKMSAVSLNYRDLVNQRNLAGRNVEGVIPTSDGVGVVDRVGPGVETISVGDRVAGCFFQGWLDGRFDLAYHKRDLGGTIDGMLAEYRTLGADGVVKVPATLTDEEAACLPCAGVTAHHALFDRAKISKNDRALILGTGGVSIFALQFVRSIGAEAIVASSSDEKLERAEALGAAGLINYRRTPEWSKEVKRLTGDRGVDVVVETGGPGTLEQSIASLRPGGAVLLIGVLSGFGAPTGSLFPLMARNGTIHGIYVGSKADFERMNEHVVRTGVRPIVDRVFSFDEAAEAYQRLARGEHFGKLVVKFD